MNKTVKITCDEQGQYSVGEDAVAAAEPPMDGQDAAGTAPTMQPAKDLDDALAQARALLEGSDAAAKAEAAQADTDMQAGFMSASRGAAPY